MFKLNEGFQKDLLYLLLMDKESGFPDTVNEDIIEDKNEELRRTNTSLN